LPSPAAGSTKSSAQPQGSNQPCTSGTAKAAANPAGNAGKKAPCTPGGPNKGQKGPKGNPKPANGKRAGVKPPSNKRRDLAQSIQSDLNVYALTKVYSRALEKTFKTKAALDAFNLWAAANDDKIDPKAYVVCVECGHCDLTLCDCWVTAAPSAVSAPPDAMIAIPSGPSNIRWRFAWVDQVKRMFAWPSYSPDVNVNHNIGWLRNSALPEEDLLLPEMLAYIRINQNTSYKINGVFDRGAKLAHSKKLALRYLDELKVPLEERTSARFVSCLHHTIQKAADNVDDDFLLAQNNEDHNITSYFQSVPVSLRTCLLVAAVASPILFARLVNAKMSLDAWILRRLITANARTMAHGSVLALRTAAHTFAQLGIAARDIIWSGISQFYYSGIPRSLCSTALTTLRTAYETVISNVRPSLSPMLIYINGCGQMALQYAMHGVHYVSNVVVPRLQSMQASAVSAQILHRSSAILARVSLPSMPSPPEL